MKICQPPAEDRRHARRQATREAILDAAENLVLEHGYEGLRTRDLVELAGVSERTVFNHFENLEAILLARIEDYLRPLILEPAFPAGLEVPELPQAVLQRFRDSIVTPEGQQRFAGFIRLASSLVSMEGQLLARQVMLTLLDVSKHLALDIDEKYPLDLDQSLSLHLFSTHLSLAVGMGLVRSLGQDVASLEGLDRSQIRPDVQQLIPHLNWAFDRVVEGMPRF